MNMPQIRIADTSGQDVQIAPRSRRGIYAIIGGAAIAVVIAAVLVYPSLSRWSAAETSVSGARLRYATVTRGDFIRDISAQGRVVAGVSPTLYASQTGTVTFESSPGDRVQTGDVVARIDSPEVTNKLEQERSTLTRYQIELERQGIEAKQQKLENQKKMDQAQVQLTAADREARRAEQAYANKAISQIDFEKAHDDQKSAQLAHQHAVADAELAAERLGFELKTKQLEVERQRLLVTDLERQVDELTVRSPVDGVVGNWLVAQKSSVSKNLPVLSVVDLTQFEVEVQVPEAYADDLGIGMTAEVRSGEEIARASLVSISPEIIDSQVTCRLRFEGKPLQGLRQNQRLTSRILLEARNGVLMLSRGQFLESGGGRIAYVVQDGMAVRRPIEIGARSLNAVEVTGGLQEGDEVVISNTDNFEGAERVLITD